MKLKYTALLLVAVSTAAQAQYAAPRASKHGLTSLKPAHTVVDAPQNMAKAAGDTVWTEDFANGFAGNNPSGAWTTGEADGNWWVYSHTGPNGAYSNNTEVIESTTAANGFMIFQADSGNTNWADTTIVAAPTSWYGALVSPIIDLTATPYVRVDFEQSQRWCCSAAPQHVEVSSDGGATWPISIPVITAAVNVDQGTITGSANITGGIAANPAQARFRFVWDGTASGSSHYHWQVDDVKLIEVFDYDLMMMSAANHSFDLDLSFGYDSLQYTVYPYSQLRPVPLNMTVLNNGSADQTGVTANFKVTEGANTVLDQDQIVACPPGSIQTFFVSPDFTPPAVEGTYDCEYSIASAVSELTPGDNTATSEFSVSQYSYGRDGGVASGFETGDDASGPYELGNLFHIKNEVELTAVSVAFRSGAGMAGTLVRGSVRLVDADFTLVDNTEEYELQSGDLNSAAGTKFVNLLFANPVTLDAETPYMVCVEHFGGTNLRTGSNGVSADQTSFIFFDGPNGVDWYFTTTTPMVRMNFDPAVGIDEEAARELALRAAPSVFTDATTVRFQHDGGQASWTLVDVSGRVLRSVDMGNLGAGNQNIEIDGNGLAAGHYMVRVVSNGAAASVKLLKAGK